MNFFMGRGALQQAASTGQQAPQNPQLQVPQSNEYLRGITDAYMHQKALQDANSLKKKKKQPMLEEDQ